MIDVNSTTILLLTIPRTGTHFLQYLLFEGNGRIIPVSGNSWLNGKNPISYKPDHCLIVEHFHPSNINTINTILNSGIDIKVVVPMQDLMHSFISAKLMGHKDFFKSIDAFVSTIDSIPHHKFILDNKKTKSKEIDDLLFYTGITASIDIKTKYTNSPSINSVRPDDQTIITNPNAALLRSVYDDIKAKYAIGDINGIRGYFPEVDLLINNTDLKLKMATFGYNKADISWI